MNITSRFISLALLATLLSAQTAQTALPSLAERAEAGDPYSQLVLGLKYYNSNSSNGCKRLSDGKLCPTKNVDKGLKWIKRAVKAYEASSFENHDLLSSEVCELLRATANENQTNLRQAYLWALKGMNENSGDTESAICMRDMYESRELRAVMPAASLAWESRHRNDEKKFNNFFYKAELKEQPKWILEARQEIAEESLPVFSYYFNDDQIEMEIYKDGRIFTRLTKIVNSEKKLLMKVTSGKINEFLMEIKRIGFYQWTMNDTAIWICEKQCKTSQMQIVSRANQSVRRLFLKHIYLDDFNEDDIAKFQMTPNEVVSQKKAIEKHKKNKVNRYFAKIKNVIDKYFPTSEFRCGLEVLKYEKKACLQRDEFWADIAKK